MHLSPEATLPHTPCCPGAQGILQKCLGHQSRGPRGLRAQALGFSLLDLYLQGCACTPCRSVALRGGPGILLQLVQGARDDKLALGQRGHEACAVAGALLLKSSFSAAPQESVRGLGWEDADASHQAYISCNLSYMGEGRIAGCMDMPAAAELVE